MITTKKCISYFICFICFFIILIIDVKTILLPFLISYHLLKQYLSGVQANFDFLYNHTELILKINIISFLILIIISIYKNNRKFRRCDLIYLITRDIYDIFEQSIFFLYYGITVIFLYTILIKSTSFLEVKIAIIVISTSIANILLTNFISDEDLWEKKQLQKRRIIMENEKTKTEEIEEFRGEIKEFRGEMEKFREEMQAFLKEEGFVETIRDDINSDIDNCGVTFGKFAMMRKEFLEENYWSIYFNLTCDKDQPFIEHFQYIDKRASEMYNKLFNEYLDKYKNEDMARSALEEFIIKEVVEDVSFSEEVFNRPKRELTDEEIENLPF